MTAPFAAIEAATAASALAALANATASLNGGAAVEVVYDNAYVRGDVGDLGMASTQPAIIVATADVPASPRGKTASVVSTIHGTLSYKVVDHEPDGTGLSVLYLEKA